jgi:aspartate-semialdehyde dehydrogenase
MVGSPGTEQCCSVPGDYFLVGEIMKKKDKYNIAVVGAKGAVGHEMIKLLADSPIPVGEFRPFGSARTAGQKISFRGKEYVNQELRFTRDQFQGIDVVLSSPGASVSKKFIDAALAEGCVVVDNTSAFRMDPKVPLVVPEINGADIAKHQGIIANPNCSAIMMLMAVAPLHRKNKIKRIHCATYQAVSGAGATAMVELYNQAKEFVGRVENNPKAKIDLLAAVQDETELLSSKPLAKSVFPHQIAFNLFSHNSAIEDKRYNGEELKMIQESKKILHDDSIKIVTTCVRVPVLRAHTEVIYLEFERKMAPEEAREILRAAPGVDIQDDAGLNHFPMPIEASGRKKVLVGRIREDLSSDHGLALMVSGDQLWKGAALNAVQIAEYLVNHASS